jgi:hypothetical protein
LDDIQDPVARAEAKKHRAIARRNAEKPDPPAAAPLQGDFVTKKELAVTATNDAKELVSQEIRDNWDELLKIPLGGYNALDARSIAKNMASRLTIFKEGKTETPSNPAAPLQVNSGARGTQGASQAPNPKEPPGFKQPVSPNEWVPEQYRKKS